LPGVSGRALGGGLPDVTAKAPVPLPVVTAKAVVIVEGVVDPEMAASHRFAFGH